MRTQISEVINKTGGIINNTTEISRISKSQFNKTTCQETGQPRRNGETLRNIQITKTELGRKRKYE